MSSSRSCSNNGTFLVLLAFLLFSGCASAGKPEGGIRTAPKGLHVAVLPVENLSRNRAPLAEIRQSLIRRLRDRGFHILNEDSLQVFMARNRMRYVGGINEALAKALNAETGSDAVLITSLELYNEVDPPKMAITSRLVSADKDAVILWMDSAAVSGDESPGILGRGLIGDPSVIREKALGRLMASLQASPKKGSSWGGENPQPRLHSTFRPKISYGSLLLDPGKTYTVAVMPFGNLSPRQTADDILALQFVRQLAGRRNFRVVDPGMVRQRLLNMRIIMPEGPSVNDADLIFQSLGADLIFTGKVMAYSDYEGVGETRVDFTAIVMEKTTGKIGWASLSYNTGNDRVYLFQWGKLATAHSLASEMTGLIVNSLFKE